MSSKYKKDAETKSAEENKDTDYFGFTEDYQYDRATDYNVESPKINLMKIMMYIGISFGAVVIIYILFIAGWLAWNSFENDPGWIKIVKTTIAILFAPMYLFYIFLKSIIFKLPN